MDIVKIASETIEGLFNMRLALPVALVRALTEGLDEVLRKWVFMHSLCISEANQTSPGLMCLSCRVCEASSTCPVLLSCTESLL